MLAQPHATAMAPVRRTIGTPGNNENIDRSNTEEAA
jgi:hypothetical protein